MKMLIVHAHHEPKSFCSALARTAEKEFIAQGHTVDFADLYAEQFNPVSDRRNFSSVKDPDYLKQQAEEAKATQVGGFAPELETQIRRLETCDLLVFSFPLWWFGLPAILKGWIDRVFASGRIYGGEQIFETGLGKSRKRALALVTTGGGALAYGGRGVQPPMDTVMAPILHGIFWFNGFLPLAPFIAWSPARISAEERSIYLNALETRLQTITTEPPLVIPPLADFPAWGSDTKKRFMVTVRPEGPVTDQIKTLIPAETARLVELKRMGVLLNSYLAPTDAQPWRGFLHFRESDIAAVRAHLQSLPLAPWLQFEVTEVV